MQQYVNALFQKVKQHYIACEYTPFLELIDNALLLAEQHNDMERFVDLTLDKASVHFQFQDYEIAIQALNEVEDIIGERPGEARIRFMSLKAAVYGALEDLASCYTYLCAAKELAERKKSIRNLKTIETNLCHYFLKTEQDEEAEKALQRAFALHEQLVKDNERLYLSGHTRYIQLQVKRQQFDEAAKRIAYVESQEQLEAHPHYKHFIRAVIMYECASGQYELAYNRLKKEMERFVHDASMYSYLYDDFVEVAEHVEPLAQYVNTLSAYRGYLNEQQEKQQQQRADRMSIYFKTDHLEQLIWLDPLTQIKNRRYLEDHANDWLQEIDTGIAAILFDADHFKRINDTYGHDVGDQVICLMAKCADSFFEAHEALFVRYGGDEFLALCSIESKEQLTSLLQNFQCMMHTQSYAENKQLQISIGATFYEEPPYELEQLIREADEALYRVKQNGRHDFAIHEMMNKQA